MRNNKTCIYIVKRYYIVRSKTHYNHNYGMVCTTTQFKSERSHQIHQLESMKTKRPTQCLILWWEISIVASNTVVYTISFGIKWRRVLNIYYSNSWQHCCFGIRIKLCSYSNVPVLKTIKMISEFTVWFLV